MEDIIKRLFADVLQVETDEISDSTTPEDLSEWDSMNQLNLIAAFEEEFSIDIEPEDIPIMMESFVVFKTAVLQKMS